MKLKTLRIENFRAFRDQTVHFDNYTCFVGPNGAGKSTALMALNVFFRQSPEPNVDLSNLTEEDFHRKQTGNPITLTLTFGDLSPDAQSTLKHYYRQGQLVVMAKAVWDPATSSAPVLQYGSRMVMASFAPYFEAVEAKAKAASLKEIYATLRKQYPDLPAASTMDAMQSSLRAYEEAHSDLCELRASADELYGVSGDSILRKYIQWVYVPPVKFASDEETEAKKTAVGQLLDKVVRQKVSFETDIKTLRDKILTEYRTLVGAKQGVLTEVAASLCQRLQAWTTPNAKVDVAWSDDESNVSVTQPLARIMAGDETFLGSLTRMGHGLQRAYLIALLEELASLAGAGDVAGPKLLLACEEPELHQHPPQQKHFMSVFEQLAEKDNQVMVTTHSPYFVSGRAFEHVRMVRNTAKTGEAIVTSTTCDTVAAELAAIRGEPKPAAPNLQQVRLQQALQPSLNEMFFSPVVVFVEGLEDVAYLTACLVLTGRWAEFRRLGCHFVPVGGKSELVQPVIIAQKFSVPCFVVFDSDTDVMEKAKAKDLPPNACELCKQTAKDRQATLLGRVTFHEKDNTRILRAFGYDKEPPFPADTVRKPNMVMWHYDIHSALAKDIGAKDLREMEDKVRTEKHLEGDGDIKKHELLIGYVLESIYVAGKKAASLEKVCDAILTFAKNVVVKPDKPAPMMELEIKDDGIMIAAAAVK